jgi:hypothetical protein
VIDDVEKMLSRLSDAAEAAEEQTNNQARSWGEEGTVSRDSFYTAPTEPEDTNASTSDATATLQPPRPRFLSTRRSAEALRPRSDALGAGAGVSKLDPARMSLFSPPRTAFGSGSGLLRKAESNTNLSDRFNFRRAGEGSAFGIPTTGTETPTRSRLIGSRDSPLRRSFRPEEREGEVGTPVGEKIVRPRSTPPREESGGKSDPTQETSPTKDMFGPRIRPTLPPRRPTEESISSPVTSRPTSTFSLPVTRPLSTPRMPPPLPPRTRSAASVSNSSVQDDAESISGTSMDYTPSEAGRELEKAFRSIGSTRSGDSTSIGSLLDTTESERNSHSNSNSNGFGGGAGSVSARNVPLPSSPAGSRLAPTTRADPEEEEAEEEEVEDLVRTPRALNLTPREPVTPTLNNPYPKPARSWVRDPYVARHLDNMGIEGPRRELLTPVEERTERTKSWSSSGISVEPLGKRYIQRGATGEVRYRVTNTHLARNDR